MNNVDLMTLQMQHDDRVQKLEARIDTLLAMQSQLIKTNAELVLTNQDLTASLIDGDCDAAGHAASLLEG